MVWDGPVQPELLVPLSAATVRPVDSRLVVLNLVQSYMDSWAYLSNAQSRAHSEEPECATSASATLRLGTSAGTASGANLKGACIETLQADLRVERVLPRVPPRLLALAPGQAPPAAARPAPPANDSESDAPVLRLAPAASATTPASRRPTRAIRPRAPPLRSRRAALRRQRLQMASAGRARRSCPGNEIPLSSQSPRRARGAGVRRGRSPPSPSRSLRRGHARGAWFPGNRTRRPTRPPRPAPSRWYQGWGSRRPPRAA